ncbi:MAG: hypothetical protein EZS28_006383 [Streblomastix strix]|uniref:Uncharacterized protein n=1 Tax=Streblomastix strix TaxID=222440 RepID=A0A5J4WV83_9EUKA|nr:MAG: hypothetical protein EZS28_006383 [Streblomastix strix]
MKLLKNLIENSANGDFAFSAESGTVWMYDYNWYNSGDIAPDQVTPTSDATPLADSGTGATGTSNEYSRGNHQHPLNLSSETPIRNISLEAVGTSTSYPRSYHQHPLNTGPTVANQTAKNSKSRVISDYVYYARSNHAHPLNVDLTVVIVPLINATAAVIGLSDYYCRIDHKHLYQLTFDGNLTITKFIKTGALATEILCANGDTINGVVDIASNQTITGDGQRTYQYRRIPNLYTSGEDVCYILYFGAGADKYGEQWARLQSQSNQLFVYLTNQTMGIATLTNVIITAAYSFLSAGYLRLRIVGCRVSGVGATYLGGDSNQNYETQANQWQIQATNLNLDMSKPLKQLFTELAKSNYDEEDLIRTTIETLQIRQ